MSKFGHMKPRVSHHVFSATTQKETRQHWSKVEIVHISMTRLLLHSKTNWCVKKICLFFSLWNQVLEKKHYTIPAVIKCKTDEICLYGVRWRESQRQTQRTVTDFGVLSSFRPHRNRRIKRMRGESGRASVRQRCSALKDKPLKVFIL